MGEPPHVGPLEPDESLPLLSRGQAQRFRHLVTDTMGRLGEQVVVSGDAMERSDGHTFGLANLSAVAALNPEDTWPAIVERHCRTIVAAANRTEIGQAALDDTLLIRLVDEGSLGPDAAATFSYASEFAPGILRILCVDEPDTVRLLPDTGVSHFTPLGPALDLGIRNLARMFDQDEVDLDRFEQVVGTETAYFDIVSSDSVYVGSYALLMDRVMARWAPGVDVSRGVIFAVPFRNVIAFRAVGDARDIIGTLQLMAPFAVTAYHRNAGPLSPNVMLWEPSGTVTALSWADETGIHVTPGPLEQYLHGFDSPD